MTLDVAVVIAQPLVLGVFALFMSLEGVLGLASCEYLEGAML